jgi:hypothetical protein
MGIMKISILTPTRNRPEMLDGMIESLKRTAPNADQIEPIFRCHSDDSESVSRLMREPFKFIVGPPLEYRQVNSAWNDMARLATGDLLMVCNDDVRFETPSWPDLVFAEATKYTDGIFVLGPEMGFNSESFGFGIVSRRVFNILGYLVEDRVMFGDVVMRDTMRNFGRAIRLPAVRVIHLWAGAGHEEYKVGAGIYADHQRNWTEEYRFLHEKCVSEAVLKITHAIARPA